MDHVQFIIQALANLGFLGTIPVPADQTCLTQFTQVRLGGFSIRHIKMRQVVPGKSQVDLAAFSNQQRVAIASGTSLKISAISCALRR